MERFFEIAKTKLVCRQGCGIHTASFHKTVQPPHALLASRAETYADRLVTHPHAPGDTRDSQKISVSVGADTFQKVAGQDSTDCCRGNISEQLRIDGRVIRWF
jgi:hypothetical protein